MTMTIRTHTCGALRKSDSGKTVVLQGWVARARDLGGLVFIDLRDRYGKTQVVVEPEQAAVIQIAHDLKSEWVIEVTGVVRARPDGMINADLPTGEVELVATGIEVLNRCPELPFQIESQDKASDELRLKYRYLDLRRTELQEVLILRHKVANIARNHFTEQGFIEVETPCLVKSTPEGARDYLVPSRVFPHQFYALPQSPQIYKQILMVAGFDKYFQICKCFRDEDLRSDRQPEFTQIDVEMSFATRDGVFAVVEELWVKILRDVWGVELPMPLKRLTYNECIEHYGSDKPDLRYDLRFENVTSHVQDTEFRVIRGALDDGGVVIGLRVPGQAELSRKQFGEVEELAKAAGLGGILPIKITAEGFSGVMSGKVDDAALAKIVQQLKGEVGDLLLLAVGKKSKVLKSLGVLRIKLAEHFKLFDPADHRKVSMFWVVDFPLFEKDEETGEVFPAHHPFTGFNPEDADRLDTEPWNVRSTSYDLVMNGNELLSGSIRIHDPILQAKIFKLLGISDEEAKLRFGFLVDALKFGAPPMGGFALGFDRMIMVLTNRPIRDVIAFPKTTLAQSLMDGSPSPVDLKLLSDLQIALAPASPQKG
ncbi:MAG: aspartate--tRNA ligase [Calditrichaeota bacterium]|nr:aspartate--tRNA ligase [Calditrichota bacterium]MCB9391586.1 aspartate--tRNA ligase [Calditrichota bacterium]